MIFFDNRFPGRMGLNGQTTKWFGSDNYKSYLKYQPNPYTEDSITYKYNEYAFRCDSFVPSDHRLVFLGCSHIEGSGLPLEETFSYQVYNEIKKRIGKEFPYWNLGLGSCGLDSMIRCYYHFHEKLRPQVVITVFPCYRLEYFEEKWYSALINNDIRKIFSKNPYLSQSNVMEYNIEKNLMILDLLLEKNKTLFIWDKWDNEIYKNVNVHLLNNFKNNINAWETVLSNSRGFPLARDGLHQGKKFNDDFAKVILDKYGDMICDQLITP